ncbi:SafA/ExsA family spore coat assembly protein [Jeotgalibacillus salarius]|uniref:SafA/ExsA family spore coat assembly protein n=1 Tax=Jeotgalibacillus salarius TaxID=546023 RepID=A0A4Y8LG40_9BACL|nr:SafA/ExsA family spore coat assembly protein [Jeotgalibacillus salarius]TFE01040.1 SafA/ExsA family spore coat assembly protein [Jeotgalibacillus salarius]
MKIHVVQKGDTLWTIAKHYQVSFEELKAINAHLANPDMIMPGMKIKIPAEKSAEKTAGKKSEYMHPYTNDKPASPQLPEETFPMPAMPYPSFMMPATPQMPVMPKMQKMPDMSAMPQIPKMPEMPKAHEKNEWEKMIGEKYCSCNEKPSVKSMEHMMPHMMQPQQMHMPPMPEQMFHPMMDHNCHPMPVCCCCGCPCHFPYRGPF